MHIAEVEVGAEDARPAVQGYRHVLHMHMVDAIGKFPDEQMGFQALPEEVAGVKVDAQGFPAVEVLQKLLGGVKIKGDLRGMDLQGKAHAAAVEFIENGCPQLDDLLEPLFHHLFRRRRERVPVGPNRRAREAGNHLNTHVLRGPGHVLHLLNGPGPDLFRLPLHLVGREGVQAGIPVIAHTLADEVRADGPAAQAVAF